MKKWEPKFKGFKGHSGMKDAKEMVGVAVGATVAMSMLPLLKKP